MITPPRQIQLEPACVGWYYGFRENYTDKTRLSVIFSPAPARLLALGKDNHKKGNAKNYGVGHI
jgi:hypothetical protein